MPADERSLVEAYVARRDEGSFRLLYQQYSPRLYLLGLRLCGGRAPEAEDVLQEMWIRACAALPRFRWDSRLSTWLSGILINCWRESRRRALPEEELEGAPEVASPPAEGHGLEALITALPERCREVLVLHDIEGYTHEEIAQSLGIASGTSKHHLFRARNLLRQRLGERPKE